MSIGVNAALKAEGGIGAEAVAARTLANPRGMEVGAFQHYVGRAFVSARALAAKYASDAHGFFGIADGEVALAEFVLLAIKRHEGRALRQGLDHDALALDHICVEAVEGLAVSHHYIIGNIDDIVDGAEANGVEFLLQPFGRLLHLATFNAHSTIARAGFGILHLNGNVKVVIVHTEALHAGTVKGCRLTVLHEIGIEVAGHAIVRAGIGAVGRDIYFDEVVALKLEIFRGRHTYGRFFGEYHNAIVALTNTDFVFGTNHTEALHTAQFAALDGEALTLGAIEHGAQGCHDYFLASGHIGRTANNLGGLARAEVNGADVHVVAIGMGLASEDMAHDKSLETAAYGLDLLHAAYFQSDGGQGLGHFLRLKVEVNVLFQPVVRNIHIGIWVVIRRLILNF